VRLFSVFVISCPYHIISSPLLFLRLLPSILFCPPFSSPLPYSQLIYPCPSSFLISSRLSSISPLLLLYLTSHLTYLLLFSPFSLSHLISLTSHPPHLSSPSPHLPSLLFVAPSCSMKRNELEQRELNNCDYTNSIN
jgi:hypothetical protein